MGSDTEEKQELEADVLARADLVACDLRSQSFRLGELRSALEQNVMTEDSAVVELGAIINGKARGRSDDRQITVCDLTGVGVQDTMIAIKTLALANEQNIGLVVS